MKEESSTCASLSVSTTLWGNHTVERQTPLPATTPSTEHHSSITVLTTLERPFNLDSCIICLILGGDIERRSECSKVQVHHFFTELSLTAQ